MTFMHMTTLADRIDRLNAAIGRGAAWLAIAVVLLQFALVVARYLFGLGSVWLSETVVYAHATLFMLAADWRGTEHMADGTRTGKVLAVPAPAPGAGWP